MLNPFKPYLIAGIGAFVLALCLVIYIQHIEIRNKNDKIVVLTSNLKETSKSLVDVKNALESVNTALQNNQDIEKQKEAIISDNLNRISIQDKSLESLQAQLQNRKSNGKCTIPKDLNDAFNTL